MAEKEKGKNTFTECNAKVNAFFFFAITQNTSWDRDSTRNKRKQPPFPPPFIWNNEIVSQLILK